ncbi:hypothetical protein JCM10213v2_007621 [Rhodosporidiobolus nylandii]
MVGLKRVEDRPTPSAIYNKRVYLAAITAAFAAVMIGYDSAFFGSTITLASFKSEFGAGKVTSNSALAAYPAGVILGRRWGLLISSIVFVVGAAIMLAAKDGNLGPIYGGRVIAGFGIGAASNLTPLYISEIAPPAIRGQLVGMYEIGWQIGGLVGFFLPYGVAQNLSPTSRTQWIVPFAVQIIPGGLFALGIPLFVRESPRWLISRSRREEAIKNLCYLRNLDERDPYLVQEINDIDLQVEHDRTSAGSGFWAPIRHLFTNWFLTRRLLIVSNLFLWQNATGINAINYYAPTIFRSVGITGGNTGLLTTGLFGVVKTVCSLLWAFFIIDHFGRRGILLVGSVGCAVSMYIVGAYIKIAQPQNNAVGASLSPGGTAAVFFLYLWTTSYAISWNGTPWVVNSEAFPGAVRTVTQCLAATSNWFWNFIIARFTPDMFRQMGDDGNGFGVYIFFASMTLLSIPYLVFLLPETKNVPLEEMDRLFLDKHPWTANKRVMATLQAERADRQNAQEEVLFQQKPAGEQQFVENAGAKKTESV